MDSSCWVHMCVQVQDSEGRQAVVSESLIDHSLLPKKGHGFDWMEDVINKDCSSIDGCCHEDRCIDGRESFEIVLSTCEEEWVHLIEDETEDEHLNGPSFKNLWLVSALLIFQDELGGFWGTPTNFQVLWASKIGKRLKSCPPFTGKVMYWHSFSFLFYRAVNHPDTIAYPNNFFET